MIPLTRRSFWRCSNRARSSKDPLIAGHYDLQKLQDLISGLACAHPKAQHAIINHHLRLISRKWYRYWAASRKWLVLLMIEFPTPAHVRQLSCDIRTAAWELVGRRSTAAKLAEIWSWRRNRPGAHAPDSLAVEPSAYHDTIKVRRSCGAELEVAQSAALGENADYAMLKSIPHRAHNALTIMAEAGDMRRLATTGVPEVLRPDGEAPVGRISWARAPVQTWQRPPGE